MLLLRLAAAEAGCHPNYRIMSVAQGRAPSRRMLVTNLCVECFCCWQGCQARHLALWHLQEQAAGGGARS